MQAEIQVRLSKEYNGKTYTKRITTSVGRLIFNEAIPQNLGYVDRTKEENICELEINQPVMKKELKKLVAVTYDKLGTSECSKLVDRLKDLGYKYSTLASITVNVFDVEEPKQKVDILKEAEAKAFENEKLLKRGLITLDEKLVNNINVWADAINKVQDAVVNSLDDFNPFRLMVLSGARGNNVQLNSVCGMVGLKSNASGQKVDTPIKASFRNGLTPIEYFLTARGGRKGLSDTALKTADSGYLTRRLVDIAQDVVITTEDCFEDLGEKVKGVEVADLVSDGFVQESLEERVYGRVAVEDIVDPKTKEIIVHANEMISKEQASQITKAGIEKVQIRSLLTCRCKHGVCAKCYGRNLAGKEKVTIGEAVGIIAAQSIGEPGTQLTMRTFHTGGSAAAADITQGLPRVEEIFEARRPKGECVLSEVGGRVRISEDAKFVKFTVESNEGDMNYEARKPVIVQVKDGQMIEPGTQLTAGPINPTDLLRTKGVKGLEDYLLTQVISVYRSQDVKVNDKHIEIIIRQMLKKVKIEDSGDTNLLAGEVVDVSRCEEENDRVLEEGGRPAMARRVLLGITKAALSTESFLSASSFQETSRVLTDASIKGKVDSLIGIKENVIIGKLIPAGTGLKQYRSVVPVQINEEVINNETEYQEAE
ncbi:MAG: DNA-directed RNA polymerase subunit beta', partial [Clostridia bacterium]|nr:DNA-directed RNA polymerase subunit beta' [Clostridia bacterium]